MIGSLTSTLGDLAAYRGYVSKKTVQLTHKDLIVSMHAQVAAVGCGIPASWVRAWTEKFLATAATPVSPKESGEQLQTRLDKMIAHIAGDASQIGTIHDFFACLKLPDPDCESEAGAWQRTLLVAHWAKLGKDVYKNVSQSSFVIFAGLLEKHISKDGSGPGKLWLYDKDARTNLSDALYIIFYEKNLSASCSADELETFENKVVQIINYGKDEENPRKRCRGSSSGPSLKVESKCEGPLGWFTEVFLAPAPLSILNSAYQWVRRERMDIMQDANSQQVNEKIAEANAIFEEESKAIPTVSELLGVHESAQKLVSHVGELKQLLIKLPGDRTSRHARTVASAQAALQEFDGRTLQLVSPVVHIVLQAAVLVDRLDDPAAPLDDPVTFGSKELTSGPELVDVLVGSRAQMTEVGKIAQAAGLMETSQSVKAIENILEVYHKMKEGSQSFDTLLADNCGPWMDVACRAIDGLYQKKAQERINAILNADVKAVGVDGATAGIEFKSLYRKQLRWLRGVIVDALLVGMPTQSDVDAAQNDQQTGTFISKFGLASVQLARVKLPVAETTPDDVVTIALEKVDNLKSQVVGKEKALIAQLADAQLETCSKALVQTLQKYPIFQKQVPAAHAPEAAGDLDAAAAGKKDAVWDAAVGVDDYMKVADHIDLTTNLPFQYQSLQRLFCSLNGKYSGFLEGKVKTALASAIVAMATVSASQVIRRAAREEAEVFQDSKLKPLGLKMADLPPCVEKALSDAKGGPGV